MAMNVPDMQSLATLLDKNTGFDRPHGQTTGYSLEEAEDEKGAAPVPSNVTVDAPAPTSIALPSTVIDQQLRLPMPTHSAEAKKKAQAARPKQPQGNEIWTQEELELVYHRKGGVVAISAAAAAAAATSESAPAPVAGAEEPVHTVLYQQSLTAEDMYLGVDFTRDNSSASSDGVVVRVEMPKVNALAELSISVEDFRLVVSSADYYLSAPMPRKVVAGVADAKWDAAKKVLVVQLKSDQSGDVKVM